MTATALFITSAAISLYPNLQFFDCDKENIENVTDATKDFATLAMRHVYAAHPELLGKPADTATDAQVQFQSRKDINEGLELLLEAKKHFDGLAL